ncbi:carbohydrate kinase family protein [Bacillus sp. mrc49]|uniref:carbohydrate kinase family protein n=1 Tax=Bacillus sp. mrc49 TaxID=2054913 RepID=UPI000C280040|nr:carbohydrate kinase [Bacillus sp. mrc49]PJN88910.1 carbohydrate kinase [Bacillus sp. mrc49]
MSGKNLVVCVGELLIDFFCMDIDVDLKAGSSFVKRAGGAPANVTAAIAKLGGTAALVSKVGSDPFGTFLIDVMKEVKVDTALVTRDDQVKTTMAFVSLQANGERDFVFFRGADEQLNIDELNLERVMAAKVLHFGSATAMLGGTALITYFNLMEIAKEKGIFLSFDPNFRANLWEGREKEFVELTKRAISKADLVKVSEEELKLISGLNDVKAGVLSLHQLGAKMITVTLGENGTFVSNGDEQSIISSIPVKSIDSTGAGDAFIGALLYQISNEENLSMFLNDYNKQKDMVSFANKVGALTCTKIGAISALPTLDEVVMKK